MNDKIILRSSIRDSHGLQTGKELLVKAIETVNGQYKIRQLVNHKREYPPNGYLDNAVLEEQNNIDLVIAEQFNYEESEEVKWDKTLLTQKLPHSIQFKKRGKSQKELEITLDPNNFKTIDKFLYVKTKLEAIVDEPFHLTTDTRKADHLDNRVILTVATYYSIVHPFVSPFLKKIGEKITEDLASDAYDIGKKKLKCLYENLRKILTTTNDHFRPSKNPVEIIFEIPGTPYIELHAKYDEVDKIVKAISPTRLKKIHNRVNELMEKVQINEAHFSLDDKGQWQFTYLLMPDGTLIGTKTIIKKRDQLVKRIDLNPTKGFSIGADVTYQNTENTL